MNFNVPSTRRPDDVWVSPPSDRSPWPTISADPATRAALLDSRILLYLTLTALLGFVAARAALSSIVHDEALTYLVFIKRSVRDIVIFRAPGSFDNNHMLLSLLAKVSVSLFGLREFTLRLPSVLAYGLYLASLCGILRAYLGGARFWLFFLAAALNPFIIDLMSIARGYGLGIALSTTAVYLLIRSVRSEQRLLTLMAAEAVMAFAVLAHFVFLLPYVALLSWRAVDTFAALLSGKIDRRGTLKEGGFALLLTAALAGVIIRPMGKIRKAGLFALPVEGHTSFFYDTVQGVADGSLYRLPYDHSLVIAVAAGGLVLVAMTVFWCAANMRRLWSDPRATALAIVTFLIVAIGIGSVLQHYFIGVGYLFGRNAAFFIPLVCIAGALLAANTETILSRGFGAAATVFCGALLPLYALALNIHMTHVWHYDASTRFMVQDLAKLGADGRKSLGTEWWFEPTLNFYIEKNHLSWLAPVTRDGPLHAYDFYYVGSATLDVLQKSVGPLKVLQHYPLTDTVLAVPAS